MPIESHFAYLKPVKTPNKGIWWHYQNDVFVAQGRMANNLGYTRQKCERWLHDVAANDGVHQREEKGEFRLNGFLHAFGVHIGFLTVSRSARFSKTEEFQFGCITKLVSQAFLSQSARGLLQRLEVLLLDSRTLLQLSPSGIILREYLKKAVALCDHAVYEAYMRGSGNRVMLGVHAEARLVTPNRTALWISRTLDGGIERQHARNSTMCTVSDRLHDAAAAYRRSQPIRSRSEEGAPRISVPIVAGKQPCLGTVTLEAPSGSKEFDCEREAALALLAAHAAGPLGRALHREEARLREGDLRELSSILTELRRSNDWTEVVSALKCGFMRLRYHRGLFCEVDHSQQLVKGCDYWGDERMRDVMKWTSRCFIKDKNDCQIRAVESGKHVIIRNPKKEGLVNVDAYNRGGLKHFGIFPFVDSRGHVFATTHIERLDTAPLGSQDVALVAHLCQAASDAYIESLLRKHERDWAKLLVSETFTSPEQLCRRFVDFLVMTRIVKRCRYYTIDDHGRQTGNYQKGDEIEAFCGFKLNGRCEPFRKALLDHRLLLVVRENAAAPQAGEDVNIIKVESVQHEKYLKKEAISQWVEIPISSEGRLAGKFVLDHSPGGGRITSNFTIMELRSLVALGRTIQPALDRIAQHELRAALCRLGTIDSFLRHEVGNWMRKLLQEKSRVRWKVLVANCKEALDQLAQFVYPSGRRGRVRLDDDVALALALAEPSRGSIQIYRPDAYADLQVPADHSLCLILLNLIQNSIDSISERTNNVRKGAGAIHLKVDRSSQAPETYRICVIDNGAGVSPGTVRQFRKPPRILRRRNGRGMGLACVRILAQDLGWTVNIAQPANPTIFEVVMGNKNV